jgi:hypothetical protein
VADRSCGTVRCGRVAAALKQQQQQQAWAWAPSPAGAAVRQPLGYRAPRGCFRCMEAPWDAHARARRELRCFNMACGRYC